LNINNNNSIDNNNISEEDAKAMNAMLGLPSDQQAWEQQQAKRKPVFKSASLTFGQNDKIKNRCTLCGDSSGSHGAINCPWSNASLLASTG
jgi:hypothetical protein